MPKYKIWQKQQNGTLKEIGITDEIDTSSFYSPSNPPNKVKDKYNNAETFLAYSKEILAKDVTYLGAWNGYELRAVHKDEVLNYNLLSNRPTSLPASDVYPWAKQSSKPSYSASEISGLANVAKTGKYTDLTHKPTLHYVNITNQNDDVNIYLLIPDYGDGGIAAIEDILYYLETIGDSYIMCSGYGNQGNDIYVGIHCFGDGKVRLNKASGQVRTFDYQSFINGYLEYNSVVLNY